MSLLRSIFKRGPKLEIQETSSALQMLQDDLVIPYYVKGALAVEKYIFALPSVNKNNLVAMAGSGETATLDVWRRGD